MSIVRWFRKRQHAINTCAGKEDFVGLFESERVTLKRLALLLTANSHLANQCLVLALRDCIEQSSVAKGWVLTWTRRVVIRNAISLVMGYGGQPLMETTHDAEKDMVVFSAEESPAPIADDQPILDLPKFDRFVFVICILERCSLNDCALLLGSSPRDVFEACKRTESRLERIGDAGDGSLQAAMLSFAARMEGAQ